MGGKSASIVSTFYLIQYVLHYQSVCSQYHHWWHYATRGNKFTNAQREGNYNLKLPIQEIYCERKECYKMSSAHVETQYRNSPQKFTPFLLPRVTQTNVDSISAWALPPLCTLCPIGLLSTPPSALDLNYSLWSDPTLRLPRENWLM